MSINGGAGREPCLLLMYIQSFLRPNTDILVVMDYPSVNDVKGLSLEYSNAVTFLRQEFRKAGLSDHVVSYYQIFDEALRGLDLRDEYFVTTKAGKASALESNGIYLKRDIEKELRRLDEVVLAAKPKVVLCMSVLALAWWFGGDSLDAWRGSMLRTAHGFNVVVSSDLYALYKRDELMMAGWQSGHAAEIS